ncbi:MAG: amino acid permease [Methylococcaceae bacterium]|nr:amino acid permease [Methylococcaceae bacterium]
MSDKTTLNRVISLPLLVFYGVGTILGAGIYSLIGKIAGLSGMYAPISFLISALIAAFVAFSYAELSSRYPKSAGEAVYVDQAFGQLWLTALMGWAVVFTGIVSAGVMAHGFYGYLNEFINITEVTGILFYVFFITVIAILGISLSVNIATLITLIEITGIVIILYVSKDGLLTLSDRWHEFIPPFTWDVWQGIVFGAFIAFYAFIGFEDMVNVAEEVVAPKKNLPAGIIIALIIATFFYVLVSFASVLSLPIDQLANHAAPFALMIKENSQIPVSVISFISLIAILNGALVQIVMGSRVLYGMAEKGLAPSGFKMLHSKTRTPTVATLFFSILLLLVALWFPIVILAKITSFVILMVFALVNISLCVIKLRNCYYSDDHFIVPIIIPGIGAVLCLSFLLLQFK